MEIAGQYQRPAASPAVAVWVPRGIWIALFLLAGVIFLVCGVIIAPRHDLPDPFLAFRDLLGDSPRKAAVAHGFTCGDGERNLPRTETYACTQRRPDAIVARQTLVVSGNIATEVNFILTENALSLGDLMLLWGRPELWLYCEAVVAAWPAQHITSLLASPQAGQRIYFSPVLSVSLTSGGPSQLKLALMNDAFHHCGGVQAGTLGARTGWG